MDTTERAEPASENKKYLTVRQAAFIGVGAMVGAGIFALLGAAGEVAGAAVWLSFLLAGFVSARLDHYAGGHPGAQHRPGLRMETRPYRYAEPDPGRRSGPLRS